MKKGSRRNSRGTLKSKLYGLFNRSAKISPQNRRKTSTTRTKTKTKINTNTKTKTKTKRTGYARYSRITSKEPRISTIGNPLN
tara:strand:+ start:1998 stop:2246 length:249 start_codon:yes stop_codon:yes gene_type:complete